MSAFFLNRAHIDALVTFAASRAVLPFDKDVLGRILWDENRKSVRARYADADACWPSVADVDAYTAADGGGDPGAGPATDGERDRSGQRC